ncbi:MAG TPA: 30S ribosomal protein S1 [Gammaproteobacteria bacterium]|nr:30S ribosomal protein S1 [Gammaproteobacteria bacterium]
MSNTNESFADLFQETLKQADIRPGATVRAKIIRITPENITVNTGLKSDAVVPAEEFRGETVQLGDEINVIVETLEDGFGNTRVSREKARRTEAWEQLEKAFTSGQTVMGLVTERVKGGFTVDLNSVRAFLPGSLVDLRSTREAAALEGKELEFKVIKMDQKRNNIVVSRRAVVEEESGGERQALLESLKEGQEFTGVVKNITDYGAFIDLGGIDGLLHITDMAWRRVKHPSEILKVGDEIKVKVLKYDRDKKRVSLGLKQLGEDPWLDIARRYPVNTHLFGNITNITDYGCFVQIEDGIEGLVHMSEMDWTNKNVHPAKLVQPGQEVEVMVLEIDEERRRISLGMKQCQPNPWAEFANNHNKGEKVSGSVKSITDFGIFIGLEGGIDGLVHLSDISWKDTGEAAIRKYKKGDQLEAVILAIDPERERISLGVKQLESDPIGKFLEDHPKGTIVNGQVTSVDAKRAVIDLGNGLQGHLRVSEISHEQLKDAQEFFKVGDEVTAKLIGVDRKLNIFNLSLKALDEETKEPKASSKKEPIVGTTLGDLFREQVKGDKNNKE